MIFVISQNANISDAISILAVFVVSTFRLLPSANRLVNSINQIRDGLPPAKLFIDDIEKIIYQYSNDKEIISFNIAIDLKNISFKYKNSENLLLKI